MSQQKDKNQGISQSPQSHKAQQTTYRYVNTEISSNQKWSQSPYNNARTPVRESTLSNNKERSYLQGFSGKPQQKVSILPVSFEGSRSPIPPTTSQQSLLSVTQIQRLKLRVLYLQEQLLIAREQNQQIMRQKKTLNQNYIQLINKQIEAEEQKHQQLAKMKLAHAQELNQYSHQLSACSQAVSRLQLQALKHQEEREIQLRLSRERQAGLLDTISKMEKQLSQLKNQSHSSLMKITQYQGLLNKKQAQIQQLQNQLSIQSKTITLNKAQYQSLMKMFTSVQGQSRSLQSQTQSLNHTITQLHQQLTLNQSTINKLNEQIQVLIKFDQQSHDQLALHQQTIDHLKQQNHSLNLSYSELLTSSQQSIGALKQNQQALLSQINTLNLLHSKLRQQNMTFIKHVDNLKDRQTLLIESEKNARQKLTTNMEKKNKQIQDLCLQNQRLYKEINKIKFKPHNHRIPTVIPSNQFNQTQSSFIHNFNPSK